MYAQIEKSKNNKGRAVANSADQKKSSVKQGLTFVDKRQQTIVQKVIQRRAADPFERGSIDSPQVHHIISHAKLTGGLNMLDAQGKTEVKRAFLPTDKKITIRQLYQIEKELVFKNNDAKVQEENSLLNKQNEWFDDMPWTDQPITNLNRSKITITNQKLGFNATTLDSWLTSYNSVKAGTGFTVGTQYYWDSLKNSYFEWSGGNLFYGAQKRVEPGGADLEKFDEDAKYFRNPEHVARLKKLAKELEAAGNDPHKVKTKLIEIGAVNKDAGAGPKNDRTKWFKPQSDIQKQKVIEVLDPGNRADFFKGQSTYEVLPKQLIIDQIEKWSIKKAKNKPSKKEAFSLYKYAFKNSQVKPKLYDLNVERESKRNSGSRVKIESVTAKKEKFYYQDSKVSLEDIVKDVHVILISDFEARRKHELNI